MTVRALVTLVVVAVACARQSGRHASAASAGDVALRVENHHWLDVTVYVEHDGQRTRVGTVTAASSTEFLLPMRLLGTARQFRLFGEAIGSPETVRTETLSLQPGQYIEWTLEHDLRRSSVGVF